MSKNKIRQTHSVKIYSEGDSDLYNSSALAETTYQTKRIWSSDWVCMVQTYHQIIFYIETQHEKLQKSIKKNKDPLNLNGDAHV